MIFSTHSTCAFFNIILVLNGQRSIKLREKLKFHARYKAYVLYCLQILLLFFGVNLRI